MTLRYLASFAFAGCVFLAPTVQATNGYWSIGYGPKSKSLAGACIGMRFGAMCSAVNPGSLAFVGNRMEAGLALFAPDRGFTAHADIEFPPQNAAFMPPGRHTSNNDWFLIPHFAYNRMIDERSSLGIAIGGNGGMNTEYSSPSHSLVPMPAIFSAFNPSNQPGMGQIPGIEQFNATSPTGIDMMQLFIGVTYSRKINAHHGIGITPIFAIQSMDVQGLEPFKLFSKYPDHMTGNGRDFSYGGGLRVGWSGEIANGLILGASYQTKLWMTKFDDYKGLLADEGNFDIPANLDLGFSYRFAPDWTFAFGYQKIFYAEVPSVGHHPDAVFTPDLMGASAIAMLESIGMPMAPGMGQHPAFGSHDGLGFGWDNMNVFKFGLQWRYSPEWTFRAGYSHASDAFPESHAFFNLLAPATIKNHYTFGFTHTLKNHHEINFSLTYAANEKVAGINSNTGSQTGFIEMNQWEVELGWAMPF
jgi:long-chain fatty acid transport protein